MLTAQVASVAGDLTTLSAFGLLVGAASFSVSRKLITTSTPNPPLIDAPLLYGAITVDSSAPKNQQLTFGTRAMT